MPDLSLDALWISYPLQIRWPSQSFRVNKSTTYSVSFCIENRGLQRVLDYLSSKATTMLCPLSGLNPLQGPRMLIAEDDLGPVSSEMALEIVSYGESSLDLDELTSILSGALSFTLPSSQSKRNRNDAYKLPDGIFDWGDKAVLGIAHWDHQGLGQRKPIEVNGRYRSGLGVGTRVLSDFDEYGYFLSFVVEGENGEEESRVYSYTCCSSVGGWPFFVLRPCFEYLRKWLDPNLPPRIAFKDSAPTMSLEGELYEILHTRIEERGMRGCIPSFDYDSIPDTFENDQFRFRNGRRGSRHVSRAIAKGLRDEELLPALYADFRCWQSMRPDFWPSPPSDPSLPLFFQYPYSSSSTDPFRQLPTELFQEILYYLPIPDILALSSASLGLRAHVTEPGFLNRVIKTAILSGTEFWILPVPTVRREKERAWETAAKWIPLSRNTGSPFLCPSFPYTAFLHACYSSDSMRNRQRLWRVVKQYDVLWRDYRLNGWERDDVLTFDPYIPPPSNRR